MKTKKIQDLSSIELETLFNQKIMEVFYQKNQSLPKEIEAIHVIQRLWNEILFEDEIEDTIKLYKIDQIHFGLNLLGMESCFEAVSEFYNFPTDANKSKLVNYYEGINFEVILCDALCQQANIVEPFLNIDK